MEIRVAIVEDEDMWADALSGFLEKYQSENPDIRFVFQRYRDGDEIAENYRGEYDIILMDIEMQFMNGMQAAESIRLRDNSVEIIFVTNMAKYAIEGYKVRAMDYVLKPISYNAFSESLKRAINEVKKREEKFVCINQKDGVLKVGISEIRYIESHGHRLTFHMDHHNVETTVFSIKQMEEVLKNDGFFRCNSGCLINLKYVKGVKEGEVFIGEDRISVSRSKKQEFMETLVSRMTY